MHFGVGEVYFGRTATHFANSFMLFMFFGKCTFHANNEERKFVFKIVKIKKNICTHYSSQVFGRKIKRLTHRIDNK